MVLSLLTIWARQFYSSYFNLLPDHSESGTRFDRQVTEANSLFSSIIFWWTTAITFPSTSRFWMFGTIFWSGSRGDNNKSQLSAMHNIAIFCHVPLVSSTENHCCSVLNDYDMYCDRVQVSDDIWVLCPRLQWFHFWCKWKGRLPKCSLLKAGEERYLLHTMARWQILRKLHTAEIKVSLMFHDILYLSKKLTDCSTWVILQFGGALSLLHNNSSNLQETSLGVHKLFKIHSFGLTSHGKCLPRVSSKSPCLLKRKHDSY